MSWLLVYQLPSEPEEEPGSSSSAPRDPATMELVLFSSPVPGAWAPAGEDQESPGSFHVGIQ